MKQIHPNQTKTIATGRETNLALNVMSTENKLAGSHLAPFSNPTNNLKGLKMSTKITIADQEFTLSSIPLVGMVKIINHIDKVGQEFNADTVDALIDGLYFGVKRNHPEVNRELFEWNIDASNIGVLLKAFQDLNASTFGKTQAIVKGKK